jgi:hypothetical protein
MLKTRILIAMLVFPLALFTALRPYTPIVRTRWVGIWSMKLCWPHILWLSRKKQV